MTWRHTGRLGRRALLGLVGALLGAPLGTLAVVGVAPAQTSNYPERVLTLVVPFPAGGSVDIIARILQTPLEKALGRTVVVDNKPGASGMIGTNIVAKAAPDGHSLLLVASTHTINPAFNSSMAYDTVRDLAPIVIAANNPFFFLVNPKVPTRTFSEFVALAKAEPGKLNYASPGATSQARLVMEVLSQRAGMKLQHVPYRGSGPIIPAMLAGDVELTLLSPLASIDRVREGSLRLIATGGLTRDPQFPDVPTVAESGFPGFEANQWFGLLTTAGTPPAIIERLNAEVNKILQLPETAAKLLHHGVSAGGGTPEQFAKLVAVEVRNYTEVVASAGIKAN
jgi:tripartite-type tricarboxylate transporter receptor subunit TctC